MPVEFAHSVIGSAYLVLWLIIAQISFRQGPTDSDGITRGDSWSGAAERHG